MTKQVQERNTATLAELLRVRSTRDWGFVEPVTCRNVDVFWLRVDESIPFAALMSGPALLSVNTEVSVEKVKRKAIEYTSL